MIVYCLSVIGYCLLMKTCYRVNEIFYSLQGEGFHTGRAAIFVRFSGCNLRCSFCDTDFSSYQEMMGEEIIRAISDYPGRFVVLTGGEPTLQVDDALIDLFHRNGYTVAMETNGTHPWPASLDWSTVSPKEKVVVTKCNELKVVFQQQPEEEIEQLMEQIQADHYFLQPCDTGDAEKNRVIVAACVDYIKAHPRWRLSLQIHKITDIK